MSYCIICFTKILTLAIAPFLFILVGIVCEFAIVPGVYILLSPQEEKVHYTILLEDRDVKFSSTLLKDRVVVELEKTQTRNSAVLWCLL